MSERGIDRSRLGPETRAILHALKPIYPERFNDAIWEFDRLGLTNRYRVYLRSEYSADRGITMTAATVTTQLTIPFSHEWLRCDMYHTDNLYAAGIDQWIGDLYRKVGLVPELLRMRDHVFTIDTDESVMTVLFENPDCWSFEPSTYDLDLFGSNTHIIFPLFYVRRLGEE